MVPDLWFTDLWAPRSVRIYLNSRGTKGGVRIFSTPATAPSTSSSTVTKKRGVRILSAPKWQHLSPAALLPTSQSPPCHWRELTKKSILTHVSPPPSLPKDNGPVVAGMEIRAAPGTLETGGPRWSYGVIDGGLELMTLALPRMTYAWGTRRQQESPTFLASRAPGVALSSGSRLGRKLVQQHPVDLVFLERGRASEQDYTSMPPWEHGLGPQPSIKCLIESWPPQASLWRYGPVSKIASTRWEDWGYSTHCRVVNATQVGGAIQQERLLVVRWNKDQGKTWQWAPEESSNSPARPMGNLLTPPGLIRGRRLPAPPKSLQAPLAHEDPMPCTSGHYIRTERGVRRLERDELARGLGLPSSESKEDIPVGLLHGTTSLFHWEYFAESLHLSLNQTQDSETPPTPLSVSNLQSILGKPAGVAPGSPPMPFNWKPPDLSPGGKWYTESVAKLEEASQTYPEPGAILQEGLEMLERHRHNYTSEGPDPQHLQLLWWEFPQEHWEPLRTGSPMNFLQPPEPVHHPNAKMDETQKEVAVEFVEELMELGVLQPLPEGEEVLSTAPLFCVPKEGQPGQWRVIADMLRGGQNGCIGSDPVILPRVTHILDSLYTEGWSAVVDASKFFYQFPTAREDRPYLGIIHPGTGQVLAYYGLPMGSRNSPALASRYGLAFIRKLIEETPIFQGEVEANCYWQSFGPGDGTFDPKLGYGYVLRRPNGEAAARIWVFVDDFLIHAPTQEACSEALTAFLDLSVRCGILCHPKKLVPPSQVVKYCGVLLDTTGIPTCRIPETKKDRALAMVKYLLGHPSKRWSRLALAVTVGVLESLAECTPRRIGHTYLRNFQIQLHPGGTPGGLEPYLTQVQLGERTLQELKWWETHLLIGQGRVVRGTSAGTLVPTFGDGSGTGTGGTFRLPDEPLKMWKGKWLPCIHHYSSNWKELSTLRLTLENLVQEGTSTVQGSTLFYFTDNSTTYWISSNGSSKNSKLHLTLEQIRSLEVKLGCHLNVVHVPGLLMIQEGTDGLSRGIWINPWHETISRDQLLSHIFSPLPVNWELVNQYVQECIPAWHADHPGPPLPPQWPSWSLQPWDTPPHLLQLRGRFTVWFPPPELARQAITLLLEAYAECPLHTSGLLFVPRIIPAFWRGLSKCLQELPAVYPHLTPLSPSPLLPIPVTVLYLPRHHRSLQPRTLDSSPPPTRARWHQAQAQQMRGMLEEDTLNGGLATVPLPDHWVPAAWS